jgi:hypothetical protein
MKNWLRNKLHNFIFAPDRGELVASKHHNVTIGGRGHHSQTLGSDAEPLRFTVYNASGGKIVEISHYDSKRDRHETSLHIIGSDEDFGDSLGKIAFLEILKKG